MNRDLAISSIFLFVYFMHGSILPVTTPPPRATPGTSPALRARGGELSETVLSRGWGAGQIENNFSFFL